MPRPSSRQLWAQKLLSPQKSATQQPATRSHLSSSPHIRKPFFGKILGIDPSLRGTGVALIEFPLNASQPILIHSEKIIISPKIPMPEALAQIHLTLDRLARQFSPRHAALEQTIYVQNFQTAQILGAARGACITALAINQTTVFEYPPLRVKQAIVGVGRASKEQVLRTVSSLVSHPGKQITYDEADAIATALCHAFTWRET